VLVGMLLVSVAVIMADAKLPEVGDTVAIITRYTGLTFMWMIGNVTDQDDSTICIDCLSAEIGDGNGGTSGVVDSDFLGYNCLGKSSYLILKVIPDGQVGEIMADINEEHRKKGVMRREAA